MRLKIPALTFIFLLSNIFATPAFAIRHQDRTAQLLLSGARGWLARDREDLAQISLKKLILIEPHSIVGLFMLGNIALNHKKIDVAARYLRTLQKIAPNHNKTQELANAYLLATRDKASMDRIRALAKAGRNLEAEHALKQLIPNVPPEGEISIDYYRIVGATRTGYKPALNALSTLYKKTADIRYRLLQLELKSNRSEDLASAISGYEDLSNGSNVNSKRLQTNWRNSLYRFPDNARKLAAIKIYVRTYPNDIKMRAILADVQRNIQGLHFAKGGIHLALTERERIQEKKLAAIKAAAKQRAIAKKEAEAEAEAEPEIDPDIEKRTEALDALDDGKIQFAETSLLDVLKRRPRDPNVLGGLGLVNQKRRNFNAAEKWFKQALLAAQAEKLETGRWESLIETAQFSQYMTHAKKLLSNNKLPEAEAAIHQAQDLKPQDPDAMAVLGNIRVKQNRNIEAEQLYHAALKTEGYNIFAAEGLANLLAHTHRQAEAIKLIEQVLRDYPSEWEKTPYSQASLLRAVSNLYIEAHQRGPAMKALEKAVEVDPKNPWIRFSLGKLYIGLNLTPLARQVMREGVTASPKDPTMYYVQALVLFSLDDYGRALDSLAQIPDNKLSPAMLRTRGRTLRKYYFLQAQNKLAQGDRPAAIKIMAIAETQAENDSTATEQVANNWFDLGLQKQGLRAMHRLPQPAPLDAQVFYASLLNRAKKDAELTDYLPDLHIPNNIANKKLRTTIQEIELSMASRQYDQLIDAHKSDQAQQLAENVLNANQLSRSQYFKYLHRYFSHAKLPADAINQLNQAKDQNPEDMDIRTDLANAYYKNKQTSEANNEVRELLAMTKADNIEGRIKIAKLQAGIGDNQGAKQTLNELTIRYPNNTDVLIQAGNVARNTGEYNLAMDYYEKTIQQGQQSKEKFSNTKTNSPINLLLNLLPDTPLHTTKHLGIARAMAGTKESNKIYHSAIETRIVKKDFFSNSNVAYAARAMDNIAKRSDPKVETGIEFQNKSGASGMSTHNGTEIPVITRFPIGYEAQGTVQVDKIEIDAGTLPTAFADASKFGTILTKGALAAPLRQHASGTSVGIGYEQGSIKADIGVVGIGFPVRNVVGGLRKRGRIGRLSYSLNLSRRPYTNSLLSYAGTTDPVTGKVWGGITNTGISLYLSSTLSSATTGDVNVSFMGNLGILRGKNVANNERASWGITVDKDIYADNDMVLNVAFDTTFTSYTNNQNYYSFGNGGYYSPQSSIRFKLPIELHGHTENLSYKLVSSVNYSSTRENTALYFPNNPALQTKAARLAKGTYAGGAGGGFGYGLRAATEYRFTPHIAMGGQVSIQRSAYYAPNSFLLYIRYLIKPVTGPIPMKPNLVTPYSRY
ncbi:MAG: cellulose synthase subunit BcsC-related outer membrane protein [Gallionella sp.]